MDSKKDREQGEDKHMEKGEGGKVSWNKGITAGEMEVERCPAVD